MYGVSLVELVRRAQLTTRRAEETPARPGTLGLPALAAPPADLAAFLPDADDAFERGLLRRREQNATKHVNDPSRDSTFDDAEDYCGGCNELHSFCLCEKN